MPPYLGLGKRELMLHQQVASIRTRENRRALFRRGFLPGSLPSHAEKRHRPAWNSTGFRRSASGLRRLDGNVHPKPAAEITFSIAGGLIISVVLCQLGADIVAERSGRSVAGHTGSL
jgi:hypothetical protein